jgi:hypothetical protein
MKIANGMVAKAMVLGLAAGALMFATPAKATAQGFAVGVQVGRPYYGYDRFEVERSREFLRRGEFRRHEEWDRVQRFDRRYR